MSKSSQSIREEALSGTELLWGIGSDGGIVPMAGSHNGVPPMLDERVFFGEWW
jgi:hypothetical protein